MDSLKLGMQMNTEIIFRGKTIRGHQVTVKIQLIQCRATHNNIGSCSWVPGISHVQVPGGGQTSLIAPEQKKDGENPRWDSFGQDLNRTFGVCSYPIRSLENSWQVTRRELGIFGLGR